MRDTRAICPCSSPSDEQTRELSQSPTRVTDGTSADPQAAADFPRIPGHRVLSCLGRGGMGVVYLAEDTKLGRKVAVKVLLAERTSRPESHQRFLREARAMASVEHPHVVRLYAFGEIDGLPYLVMEYVAGQTLAESLARLGRLDVARAVDIVRQCAEGLAAAAERGIVHRDVKPGNILLDTQGRVRVADFGLARSELPDADSLGTMTLEGTVLGTPHYLAPEQAEGRTADHRSDIYALGLVLYEMLIGQRAHSGTTPGAIVNNRLQKPVRSVRELRSEVPRAVADLVSAMTRFHPDERPQSYPELLHSIDVLALDRVASGDRQDQTETVDLSTVPSSPLRVAGVTRIETAAASSRRDRRPTRAVLLALLTLVIAWAGWATRAKQRAAAAEVTNSQFVVVLAPFSAPGATAREEADIMRQLLYDGFVAELAGEPDYLSEADVADAEVAGHARGRLRIVVGEGVAPLSEPEAIRLGKGLDADLVVWGRVLALRGETLIEPRVSRGDRNARNWRDPTVAALRTADEKGDPFALRAAKARDVTMIALRILASEFFAYTDPTKSRKILQRVDPVALRCRDAGQVPDHLKRLEQFRAIVADNEHAACAHLGIGKSFIQFAAMLSNGASPTTQCSSEDACPRAPPPAIGRALAIEPEDPKAAFSQYFVAKHFARTDEMIMRLEQCGWVERLAALHQALGSGAAAEALLAGGDIDCGDFVEFGRYQATLDCFGREEQWSDWEHRAAVDAAIGLGDLARAERLTVEGTNWMQSIKVAFGLSTGIVKQRRASDDIEQSEQLARVALRRGRYAEARGLFEDAATYQARWGVTVSYLLESDWPRALKSLPEDVDGSDGSKLLHHQLLVRLGRPEAAAAVLEQLIARRAREVAANSRAGQFAGRPYARDATRAVLDVLRGVVPDDRIDEFWDGGSPPRYFHCLLYQALGSHYAAHGDHDRAILFLERAVATGMRHMSAWYLAQTELARLR